MRRTTALAVALVGCSAGVFGTAGAASATSSQESVDLTTALPFTSVSDMIVDTHTGHIFVSGGGTSSSTSYVEVLNLLGQVVGQIPNQQGASGMTLSADGGTLYIADAGNNSISVVNASTLAQVSSFPTTGLSPEYVALAGGELWFTTSSTLDVEEVNLATGVVSSTGDSTFYYGAALESSPYAPNTLVTGTYGSTPSTVYVYTVVSGALTLTAGGSGALNSNMECDSLNGMAITPDGKSLVLSCGAPYYAIEVTLAGLSNEDTYATGPYPNSVAVSPSGKVLVGVLDSTLPVVEFAPGDSAAIGDYGTNPSASNVPYVAWGANDSTFYAVVGGEGVNPTLESIFLAPTFTLTAPAVTHPGNTYTVAGSLTGSAVALPGVEVAVTRTEGATTTAMGTYTTNSSGAFSFTDTGASGGTTAIYTASVVGSSVTATASVATVQVTYPGSKSRPVGR